MEMDRPHILNEQASDSGAKVTLCIPTAKLPATGDLHLSFHFPDLHKARAFKILAREGLQPWRDPSPCREVN